VLRLQPDGASRRRKAALPSHSGNTFAFGMCMENSAFFKFFSAVTFVALVLSPAPAAAQQVPHAGQVAIGAELSVYFPADNQLSIGLLGGGLFEIYATPRIGIRTSVTAIRNGYDREDDDDERQLRVGVDGIYNWEHGAVHPFVGAGVGMHFLRFYRDGDNEGPNDTEFGAQVLGGAEFFLNRAWTVKGEGRYQWVGDRPNLNPDGLALSIGVKRYF
jgi:opacity protein-like surface antigen